MTYVIIVDLNRPTMHFQIAISRKRKKIPEICWCQKAPLVQGFHPLFHERVGESPVREEHFGTSGSAVSFSFPRYRNLKMHSWSIQICNSNILPLLNASFEACFSGPNKPLLAQCKPISSTHRPQADCITSISALSYLVQFLLGRYQIVCGGALNMG